MLMSPTPGIIAPTAVAIQFRNCIAPVIANHVSSQHIDLI
jgi:hypothetical protein